jgi:hypothetical protein
MNNLVIVFSASNALCKWLKLDLPRLPVIDGQRAGVQPLVTDSHTISWQCHVIFTDSWRERATVIAVEAHSRFTLLIPFDVVPSQNTLEQLICEQWANAFVELAVKHGELERSAIPRVFTQFHEVASKVGWVRNMDLSVQGHISDAEQWVKDTLVDRGLDALDEELAFDIAWHVNSLEKRAKDKRGNKRTFYPVPLFVEDGLFRFASSLVHRDDNSSPYAIETIKTDNVVSIMPYLIKK